MLFNAIESRDLEEVKKLIETGTDVNESQENGITPLIYASSKGYLEIVQELIKNGAKINARDSEYNTALMMACQNNHSDIVMELLKNGADKNLKNRGWYGPATALEIACDNGSIEIVKELLDSNEEIIASGLVAATEKGYIEIVQELLKNGANPNGRKYGEPALTAACRYNKMDVVKELLKYGADINIHSKGNANKGYTPLITASHLGHLEIVQELLKNGADIEATDEYGNTALIEACSENRYEIIKELIKNGADINVINKEGKSALSKAFVGYNILREINDNVIYELINNGADINVKDKNGYTPLMYAVNLGNINWVKSLINLGADVNIIDWEGRTPLIRASGELSGEVAVEIMEELIKNGADVNVIDNLGHSALTTQFIFYKNGKNEKIVKMLIRNDADLVYLIEKMKKDAKEEVFENVLINQIKDKDYDLVEKCLEGYYRYLNIEVNKWYYRDSIDVFNKLEEGKSFIRELMKDKYYKEQVKQKNEFKRCIKSLVCCVNESDLCKAIENIPGHVVKILSNGKSDVIRITTDSDIYTMRNELIIMLKNELNKNEKILEAVDNLKNKIEIDLKQVVFGGINKGREDKMELD